MHLSQYISPNPDWVYCYQWSELFETYITSAFVKYPYTFQWQILLGILEIKMWCEGPRILLCTPEVPWSLQIMLGSRGMKVSPVRTNSSWARQWFRTALTRDGLDVVSPVTHNMSTMSMLKFLSLNSIQIFLLIS